MIEYAVLIAALAGVGSYTTDRLGDRLAQEYGTATAYVGGDPIGICPTGWDLTVDGQTKKNGQNVDANSDGYICLKNIPGGGNGNTNNNQNVKDNNGAASGALATDPGSGDGKKKGNQKTKDKDTNRFVDQNA